MCIRDRCGNLLKYSLNSYGQDGSLAAEKISGTLSPILAGFSTTMSSGIGTAPTQTTLGITSTVGINTGDFLQIGNEIIRVKEKEPGSTTGMIVFRGVLGTQSVSHTINELARKVDIIPSEVHRFSAIRASGHTFEYIGSVSYTHLTLPTIYSV